MSRMPEIRGRRPRVLVAEDHPISREGLVRALEEHCGVEVVGDCALAEDALELAARVEPDVLLLDLRLPDRSGHEVLEEISRRRIPVRVLVFSATVEPQAIKGALRAGAGGYLSKDADVDEIRKALEDLLRGEVTLSPTVLAATLLDEDRGQDELVALTARELDVVRLVADGCTDVEIGSRLHLSPTTVKTHLKHASAKLTVNGRGAVVAAAFRRGLLA